MTTLADRNPISEKRVQHAVKQVLALHRIRYWDTSQPFRAAITPGLPDLLCICPRRGLFFVECKAERGKLTAAQEEFAALCEGVLVSHYVVRSGAEMHELLASG